ncbi:MAG: hypothetical protein JWO69_1545 [Thermoleophilia bacterium]|nr:hypothetical protein [Thermoleophilia bacterium]
MDTLASSPYGQVGATEAAQVVSTAWMDPSIVAPVAGSPAAAVATAWVPTSASANVAPQPSFLDAIADTLLAPSADSVAAAQQLAVSAAAPAPVAVAPVMTAPIAAQAATAVAEPTATTTTTEADEPTAASVLAPIAAAIGSVVGAGVARARKVGSELWAGVSNPRTIHVSQVPSKYNTAPAAGNKDCGPTSVVMALRLLGKSIPGAAAGASPQRLINRVRQLAGNANNTASTTNHELARALKNAGAKTREIHDLASIKASILEGKPVILNGNPRHPGAYGARFTPAQMTPYDGAHWIVVSGFDEKLGKYIINDPLSKVGPVKVSPAQLDAYRGGSLGIEVAG